MEVWSDLLAIWFFSLQFISTLQTDFLKWQLDNIPPSLMILIIFSHCPQNKVQIHTQDPLYLSLHLPLATCLLHSISRCTAILVDLSSAFRHVLYTFPVLKTLFHMHTHLHPSLLHAYTYIHTIPSTWLSLPYSSAQETSLPPPPSQWIRWSLYVLLYYPIIVINTPYFHYIFT